MKRISLFVLIASFITFQPTIALPSGLLVEPYSGINVTEDDNTGYYWYWDLGRFSGMTYDDQILEISSISIPGYTGTWNMATQAQMDGLTNAYTHAELMKSFSTNDTKYYFGPDPLDMEVYENYSGRYGVASQNNADYHAAYGIYFHIFIVDGVVIDPPTHQGELSYAFYGEEGFIPDGISSYTLGAWVVSTDLQAIPVPSTLVLMASGLIGCAGLRRRFRR